MSEHAVRQLVEADPRLPTERRRRLGRVADEYLGLGGPHQRRIDLHVLLPLQPGEGKSMLRELTNRACPTARDHEVIGPGVTKDSNRAFGVVGRVAPVPPCIQIAEPQRLARTRDDCSDAMGDLAKHEVRGPTR